MFERIILIVDDNERVETVYIPSYLSKINQVKKTSAKWENYSFKLIHKLSMQDALDYMKNINNCVDVLVVDYDFGSEKTFTSGTEFVKYIRSDINQYCQIVFYTMQGLGSIEKEELIDLINADVYHMVDKSDSTDKMGKILFEAATKRNPIVESLERFFQKYRTLLSTYNYSITGQDVTFEQIINHIRMDDELGRIIIEKLLQKAILTSTDIED